VSQLDLEEILNFCDQQGVPVLLDCSYYTIASNINIDLNHSCIDTVAFSLSKTFPIAHARVGMRYTRPTWQDGQKLHKNINYNNRLTAGVGLALIQEYSSDYVVNKYQEHYDYLVDLLGLTPGNSIMFADGDATWLEYGRKGLLETYGLDFDYRLFRNRICLTQLLENIELVKESICN
jgi:aspartate/methionine/tyrosine aminotransferase